jgi:hypothetical protein
MLALIGVAEVATQIVLTAVLGVSFGITGVAVAVLVAVVGVELAVRLPLVSRRLHTSVIHLVWPVVRAHLPALAVAGTAGWFWARGPAIAFVRSHGRIADMGVVVVAGLAIVLVYAATFALTGLDAETRRRVVVRLRAARNGAATAGTTPPVDQLAVRQSVTVDSTADHGH